MTTTGRTLNRRVPPLLLLGLAALSSGATCQTSRAAGAPSGAQASPSKPEPKPAPLPAPAPTSAPNALDFSALSPAAQKELAAVLSDEFCYCGCPQTLGACLKTHTACKHAKRMALLAASAAAGGATSGEIIVSLSRYYQSFREPRSTFQLDERMCLGAKDAKVTLVEFSDFECPFCGLARPMLEQYVKAEPAKARLCYLPYPLSQHPHSLPAGQAALFARDRGKFWAMHDLIFENQSQLSIPTLKELAAKLSLNAVELGKAIDSRKYLDELERFKDQGRAAGVEATPSIYVNGRKLLLDINPATIGHAVDDEIEWRANGGAFVD